MTSRSTEHCPLSQASRSLEFFQRNLATRIISGFILISVYELVFKLGINDVPLNVKEKKKKKKYQEAPWNLTDKGSFLPATYFY